MRPDLRVCGDRGDAPQNRERVHDRLRLEQDGRLDPRRGGIGDRHARQHVREVDPVAQRGAGSGKLHAGVHALRLVRVGRNVRRDSLASLDQVEHGIGEIELALGVVRLEPLERGPQSVCPEDVDRRVALPQRELLGCRVERLDDRADAAVRSADDPAVGTRLDGLEREDGRGGTLPAMRLQELARAGRTSGAACRPRGRAPRRRRPRARRGCCGSRLPCRARAPGPATSTSPNASRVAGEATTRVRAGSSGRAASSTQSTILRPRIGWRCLGTDERMRVPRPPAITTAASFVSVTGQRADQ